MQLVEEQYNSTFYGFMNGDILLNWRIIKVLEYLEKLVRDHSLYHQLFAVGRRINYSLDMDRLLPLLPSQQEQFLLERARSGTMFRPDAEVRLRTGAAS